MILVAWGKRRCSVFQQQLTMAFILMAIKTEVARANGVAELKGLAIWSYNFLSAGIQRRINVDLAAITTTVVF